MLLNDFSRSQTNTITEGTINARRVLRESCEGLTVQQQRVVEGIYRDCWPLIEATLSAQQIDQVFNTVQQDATAAGGNRTLIGRGVDAASAVNDTINKMGRWLQDTRPVQAFDQKFEQLKTTIGQKFPGLEKNLTAMGTWAKDNPGKTAAIIGVLTTIAALGAGPAGGAIAGQILRGATELLKGERLSTAVGKGVKTAAVGALAGYGIDKIGDLLGGGIRMVADNLFPGARRLNLSFMARGTGPKTFQDLRDVIGRPEDIQPIRDAWNQASAAWQAGNYTKAESLFVQAKEAAAKLADPAFVSQLTQDQSSRQAILSGAKGVMQAADALAATAQGVAAGAGAGGGGKPAAAPTAESQNLTHRQIAEMFVRVQHRTRLNEYKNMPGSTAATTTAAPITAAPTTTAASTPAKQPGLLSRAAGAVGQKLSTVGTNLTTRITADKLKSAWKSAGSPTDSAEIFKLLQKQKVPNDVIIGVFDKLQVPLPNAPETAAQAPDVSATLAKMSDDQIKAWIDKSLGQGTSEDDPVVKQAQDELQRRQGQTAPSATAQTPSKMTPDEIVDQLGSVWNKIIDNQDNPIGAPAVRQLLKSMWMRSGGTQAMESLRRYEAAMLESKKANKKIKA